MSSVDLRILIAAGLGTLAVVAVYALSVRWFYWRQFLKQRKERQAERGA